MAIAQISSESPAEEVGMRIRDLFEPTAAVKASDETQRDAADRANYAPRACQLQRRRATPDPG